MIPALDSSFDAPSLSEAQAAAGAGIRVWSGYLTTKARVGLAAPWTALAFWNAARCGSPPIGFCSGWDDPAGIHDLGAHLGVRPCLDVESGIRPDGPWVQAWLDASGAGLYGVASVHAGRRAAFHILADYPGFDPRATWPSWLQRPAGPCGWQWQGSHPEFGCSVDRSWLDDWFLKEDDMNVILVAGDGQGAPDPHGTGAVYLVRDWPYGPKRWIEDPAELGAYETIAGAVQTVPQGVLDRCEEEPPIAIGSYVVVDVAATKAELDAAKAELDQLVAGSGGAVDLTPVTKRLDALSVHLGVGTA